MSDVPEPQAVDPNPRGDYIHVRYRDPDEFETTRTEDWSEEGSDSVAEDRKVRMGKRADSDDWQLQSVLIPRDVGEDQARQQADEILRTIES